MNRLGFRLEQVVDAYNALSSLKIVKFSAVMTHLACADMRADICTEIDDGSKQ